MRGAAPFYRRGEDHILDNTWADLETRVDKLKLPVDAAFLVEKVDFDTNLAGLTDDTSLQDMFVGSLLRLEAWPGLGHKAAAHAYQIAALLRELRGSYHIVAAVAQGLTDVETMMANPGQGQARAEVFGHQAPYPDSDADRAAFERAEEATDMLMTKPWSVLTDAERDEMVELTQRLHAAATGG